MRFSWEPVPWKLNFLRSRSMKRGFMQRAQQALAWRPADETDWPSREIVGEDLDWARRTGTGFVAETDEEILYLFDRDWFGWPDPPEWSLASQTKSNGRWHIWGSFDVLPSGWNVPEIANAPN